MRWKLAPLLVMLLTVALVGTVHAHGAEIEYTLSSAVELVATYDTGEAMAGGQVTVYAPDDPANPWLIGECDEEGRFVFTPDPGKPGTWDVQVRQAGHGDMVHIVIGAGAAASGGGGLSLAQIVLMTVCVVWGFVGTALFFVSRKRTLTEADA